jgi:hypothetical protein
MPYSKEKPTGANCGLIDGIYQAVTPDRIILQYKCLPVQGGFVILDLGADNTFDRAVATPTVSGVLSCLEFNRGHHYRPRYRPRNERGRGEVQSLLTTTLYISFGQGAVVISRKTKAVGIALSMLSTPCPPYTLDKVNGGYQSHRGDMTMFILLGCYARLKTLFLSFEKEDQPVIVAGLIGLVCLFVLEVLS